MASLAQSEATLSLFTEGIAGRYFHIKATPEFTSSRLPAFAADQAGQGSDAIYLPEHLDAPDPHAYRVLVMEQLGQLECGTFSFRMEHALELLGELRARHQAPGRAGVRTGDFQLLFACFDQGELALELFNLLEKARVQGHLLRTYPGLQRHLRRYHEYLLATRQPDDDPLHCGYRSIWGDALGHPRWQPLIEVLEQVAEPDTTVYDSVAGLCRVYDRVAAACIGSENLPYDDNNESLSDWLNREQRVEEWEEELESLQQQMMAANMQAAEELDAERGENSDAATRDAEVDLKALADERDMLKRRIDMEKASIHHALGTDRSGARSYRYDEWDYLHQRYLSHWCRVYEESLSSIDDGDTTPLAEAIRHFRPLVQKQLEQIRPTGLQRIQRVQDGDELDLNAIIEARQDIRAGTSPNERFYSRKERIHRDVCTIFLVDLSASTDDPIDPPEPFDWDTYDESTDVNLRDPWLGADLEDGPNDEPKRKIIDIQREAMVVMASALEALGDSYGIYGFSGYGKDCVELYVAKEPHEVFSQKTLQAIAAMKPKRSTRMGPAIRHSTYKLMQSGHAMKVLMVISDGFPQDSDYGPERGNHDYGVEDTAKALQETQQKGVETFCVTVDRSGQDYLRRMCTDKRYLVIEEMEDLPDQLSKVYAALTGR